MCLTSEEVLRISNARCLLQSGLSDEWASILNEAARNRKRPKQKQQRKNEVVSRALVAACPDVQNGASE